MSIERTETAIERPDDAYLHLRHHDQSFRASMAPYRRCEVSETKHTPGPWFTDGPMILAHDKHAGSPAKFVVADLTGGIAKPADTREANARLIAAAPDLLAVVKDVSCAMGRYPQGLQDRITAALAKAGGK